MSATGRTGVLNCHASPIVSATGRIMRLLAAIAPVVALMAIIALLAALITRFPWRPGLILLAALAGLALPVVGYLQVLRRSERFYRSEIARGLTRAFESDRVLTDALDVETDRLIVFSDLHKGTRDGADDFWRSERAYVAALAHYLELGHRLVVLGDADELWENRAAKVLACYGDVLDLEAEFHAQGRYVRVWGNHDDDWRRARKVRRLHAALGGEIPVYEAVKLHLSGHGMLFLTHGHQGTADSQILATVSRPGVMVFGFLQRRFKRPWNTPAVDARLREPHDLAMFAWARDREETGLVLIAGHTHRPVFWRADPLVPSEGRVAELQERLDRERDSGSPPEIRARARAELEYAKAERRRGVKPPTDVDVPCYFNTGCCAFSDGDVTGIEIAGGEIRLVRWPNDAGEPAPKYLDRARLEEVFATVRRGGAEAAA